MYALKSWRTNVYNSLHCIWMITVYVRLSPLTSDTMLHSASEEKLVQRSLNDASEWHRQWESTVLQRIPGPVQSLLYGLLALVKAVTVCAFLRSADLFRE